MDVAPVLRQRTRPSSTVSTRSRCSSAGFVQLYPNHHRLHHHNDPSCHRQHTFTFRASLVMISSILPVYSATEDSKIPSRTAHIGLMREKHHVAQQLASHRAEAATNGVRQQLLLTETGFLSFSFTQTDPLECLLETVEARDIAEYSKAARKQLCVSKSRITGRCKHHLEAFGYLVVRLP
ncbi:hypothetical protein FA15DRAFT_458510 [Coprinopsis marcescibilis]|uniref:Uncharacterized protein n=1 Tax=Coprinopsis marcescibilis TaxID=230819 RepID=A0A5C3LAJ2_COPMA|nr:hypothetical protein FA15DRAFT_458510 [Coprinopsis marcescibilis]